MSLREINYSKSKLWDLRNIPCQPFAAVDPGKDGAVVVLRPPVRLANGVLDSKPVIYPLTMSLEDICERLIFQGVRLLFIENQHLGRNAQSMIHLVRRAAYLPAYLAGLGSSFYVGVTVVWVQPATWQASLRKMEGLKGKAKRGEGKQLAMKYAERMFGDDSRFTGINKELKQGIADAQAIALWAVRTLWMDEGEA